MNQGFVMRLLLASLLAVLTVTPLAAQTPREELLRLAPEDAGFCLVVSDLRTHAEAWQKLSWWKHFQSSPLVQAILNSPELGQLARIQAELKRRLDIDWPTLRDEVLGDAFVLSYKPPQPGKPETEQGLFLLKTRRGDYLTKLIGVIHQEQKKSGELKDLVPVEYQGITFHRRIEMKQTNYLWIDDGLLAFAVHEEQIRQVIDRRGKKGSTIIEQLDKAGAEKAPVALWVNPRAFDQDLESRAQKDNGPEGLMLRAFLGYWKPMDAIVLSAHIGEEVEAKLTLQANIKDLPASLKKAFTDPSRPSELWQRFPQNSIFALAGKLDAGSVLGAFTDFSTPDNRKTVFDALQRTVGAALGLDLMRDVLPNLGPDWGFCVVQGDNPKHFPHLLAALAVQPGPKEVGVDQSLYKGLQFLASLALFDYNRKHEDPIRMKSVQQDQVEVKYLANDKLFPAGFQPAWALKDGYVLLASSPEAILRFKLQNPTPSESPLVRLSCVELARFLKLHRDAVIAHVAEKNRIPQGVATQGFEAVVGLLDLIDRVSLLHASGNGQTHWTLRLEPRR